MKYVRKMVALSRRIRSEMSARHWRKVPIRKTVLSTHWGASKERERSKLCLFSTFDPKGRVDPYVKAYLHELRACGFDVVVISTSPSLLEKDIQDLKESCRAIIHRDNVGLDFASWKVATEVVSDWCDYENLLLANDSVYGPFTSLAPIIQTAEQAEESICGLTDNFEASYHIQSYFLFLKKDLFRSQIFLSFWNSIQIETDKNRVINRYEVGLSQHLLHHDIKIKALYPYYSVREVALDLADSFQYHQMIRTQPVNSSIFMWHILLKNFGFPFLKTEIVKTNRLHFLNVVYWRTFLPEGSKWINLIENHLKRAVPNARG